MYFASSGDDLRVGATQRLADALSENATANVHWRYEQTPEEKHSTIYHPAALKAFRAVFKPTASKKKN